MRENGALSSPPGGPRLNPNRLAKPKRRSPGERPGQATKAKAASTIAPPAACSPDIRSPNAVAFNANPAIGSPRLRREASELVIRRRPAKKSAIAPTVEIAATPINEGQASATTRTSRAGSRRQTDASASAANVWIHRVDERAGAPLSQRLEAKM